MPDPGGPATPTHSCCGPCFFFISMSESHKHTCTDTDTDTDTDPDPDPNPDPDTDTDTQTRFFFISMSESTRKSISGCTWSTLRGEGKAGALTSAISGLIRYFST